MLAANVRALRHARALTTEQFAALVTSHGQPMRATTITKIEQSQRRVDVDDLVAMAHAIGVEAHRLLSTPACGACLDSPPAGFLCIACGGPKETK